MFGDSVLVTMEEGEISKQPGFEEEFGFVFNPFTNKIDQATKSKLTVQAFVKTGSIIPMLSEDLLSGLKSIESLSIEELKLDIHIIPDQEFVNDGAENIDSDSDHSYGNRGESEFETIKNFETEFRRSTLGKWPRLTTVIDVFEGEDSDEINQSIMAKNEAGNIYFSRPKVSHYEQEAEENPFLGE
jgi:hypothetical protein